MWRLISSFQALAMPKNKHWMTRPLKSRETVNPASASTLPAFGAGPLSARIRLALVDALLAPSAGADSGGATVGLPVKTLVELIAQYATIHPIIVSTLVCTPNSPEQVVYRCCEVWKPTAGAAAAAAVTVTDDERWVLHIGAGPISYYRIAASSGRLVVPYRYNVRPSVWNGTRAATDAMPLELCVCVERGHGQTANSFLVGAYEPGSICRIERLPPPPAGTATAADSGSAGEWQMTTLAGLGVKSLAGGHLDSEDGSHAQFKYPTSITCSPDGKFVLATDGNLRSISLTGKHAVTTLSDAPAVTPAFDENDPSILYFGAHSGVFRYHLNPPPAGEARLDAVKLSVPAIATDAVHWIRPHHLIISRPYRLLMHNLVTNQTVTLAGGSTPGTSDGDATDGAEFRYPGATYFVRGMEAEPDRLFVVDASAASIRIVSGSIVGAI